jgi:hypothetical protein
MIQQHNPYNKGKKMSATEKIYSRVTEAKLIIEKLCEKYPKVFWRVIPSTIEVLGVENKERSKKSKKMATLKVVKGAEKAIFSENRIPTTHVIELFYSDWQTWTDSQKQWVITRELLKIGDEGKVIPFDCLNYNLILDIVGYGWEENRSLPDLLATDIDFKEDLLPGLETEEE